jgi:hypothetical protein
MASVTDFMGVQKRVKKLNLPMESDNLDDPSRSRENTFYRDNLSDPSRFDFLSYRALEERLATYTYFEPADLGGKGGGGGGGHGFKNAAALGMKKRAPWPFGPPHLHPTSTLLPVKMAEAGWVLGFRI